MEPDVRHLSHASIIFSLLLAVVLAGCGPQQAQPSTGQPAEAQASTTEPEGEKTALSVSGAFALFPLMTMWAEEYHKLHSNVTFDVQAGGAGKGMTDVLSGAADIAMLSRDARQEEIDQGALLVPVTIDSVLGTMNSANPHLAEIQAKGVTPDSGASIWISGTTTTWGQFLGTDAADKIDIYTRSDAAGAAEQWARFLGAKAQEDLHGTAVNGDPGVAEAVHQDPLGIGYNNVGFAYDPNTGKPIEGLAIVPIDLNGDGSISADENFYATRDEFTAAVADGRYPFPPARVLFLVTKGIPNPAIKDFYKWVLTDGQQYVHPAGYVALTKDKIDAALAGLNK